MTRQVIDPKVDSSYAEHQEKISPKAFIIRLPCADHGGICGKEVLWPYLDSFSDHALKHIRHIGHVPDIVHGHYAGGGYVAAQLSSLLEVPMVFTGHFPGLVKRQRLLGQGVRKETIESQYHMAQRIEAEETALDNAILVVASTQQEGSGQYSAYDNHHPDNMVVIPPGIDLKRFHPLTKSYRRPAIYKEIMRFFQGRKKTDNSRIITPRCKKKYQFAGSCLCRKPDTKGNGQSPCCCRQP